MNRLSSPGFTIVELLIVIVVLAILAAITVVSYDGIRDRADESSVRADLSNNQRLVRMAGDSDGFPVELSKECRPAGQVNSEGVMCATAGAGEIFSVTIAMGNITLRSSSVAVHMDTVSTRGVNIPKSIVRLQPTVLVLQ